MIYNIFTYILQYKNIKDCLLNTKNNKNLVFIESNLKKSSTY